MSFRSGANRQFRSYSYMAGYAQTLLAELSPANGEFPLISKIRFSAKLLPYMESRLASAFNFKKGEIGAGFPISSYPAAAKNCFFTVNRGRFCMGGLPFL